MLDHRLGDGEAVERAGAAAHLVEDHEASRRGPIENPRGLCHLHEKCARTPGEVVTGADPGEEPINDADPRPLGWNKTAGLSHHGHERRLPDERALAAHVGAGDEQDRGGPDTAGSEGEVVGHEGAGRQEILQHGMAARLDQEFAVIRDFGPHPAPRPCHLGERDEHVEDREHLGSAVEPAPLLSDEGSQLVEQEDFAANCLLLGAEHLPLPLIQLGRGVALGVFHRLFPDVVGRHLLGVRATDLEEEPEDAVVAHLERGDAGPLDLLGLVAGDPCLAATGEFQQFIERGVEAGANEAAVAGEYRTAFAEGAADPCGDVGAGVKAVAEVAEQAPEATKSGHEFWEDCCRPANPLEVARAGAAGHHAAYEPLHVADAGERRGKPPGERGVGHQRGHCVEPVIDRYLLDEWCGEPLPQQPGAHRGTRAVEHAGQGAVAAARPHRPHEFEAAARGLVDLQAPARPPRGERSDSRDRGRLILLEIGDDCAGRGDARGVGGEFEAEAFEAAAAECPPDRGIGRRHVEPPVGPGGKKSPARRLHEFCDGFAVLLATETLRGIEPQDLVGHVVAVDHRGLESASGYIDPGKTDLGPLVATGSARQDRYEPVAPRGVEQRLVGGDARRDDPRDFAAHEPLGRLSIRRRRAVNLLADRHMAARRD